MNLKMRKQKRGFTLVEIILILVLVTVLSSAVLALYSFLITLNKKIEYRSSAYKLLDSKIEEYRDVNFDALASGTVSPAPDLPENSTIATTVTSNIEGSEQTDIKLVTITISWDFKGAQNVRISTYITRGGIQR